MSNPLMPSASAVVPSTQVTNPEISDSAQRKASWDLFNDHCYYKAELKRFFKVEPYPTSYIDIIIGIYDQLLPLGGNEYHFEMFVDAVKRDRDNALDIIG
jgi:hypothetical protein